MKKLFNKSFKRAATLFIAVCLLVSMLVPISMVIANEDTDVAYKISYAKVPDGKRYTLTTDTWEAKNKAVTLTFDYYYTGPDKKLVVENIAGGGGFADAQTNDAYLRNGVNSFSFTTDSYTRDGFCVGFTITGMTEDLEADLYIWNVVATVGETNMFSESATQYGSHANISFTKITYGEIPFDSEEDDLNNTTAYKISYAKVPDGKRYTLTTDTWEAKNKAVTLTFDYYYTGPDKKLFVENIAGGGGFADAQTNDSFLRNGVNSFSFTTDSYTRDGFCVGLEVTGMTEDLEADLYIWNVVATIGETDMFSETATQYGSHANISFTKTTYGEIPFPSDGEQSGIKAYKIDFTDAKEYAYYCLTKDTWEAKGKKITASFNYYITDAMPGDIGVENAAGGGAFKDDTTDTNKLKIGVESTYTYTTESYEKDGFCMTVRNANETVKINAKVYIWNISVKVNDQEYFSETATQWGSGAKPVFSIIDYNDIPFGSTGDGGSGDGDEPEKVAYKIDFTDAKEYVNYCLTKDTWEAKGKKINASFKYYITDAIAGDIGVENAAGGGGFKDDTTDTNKLKIGKEGTFTYTTESYEKDGFCMTVRNANEHKKIEAKVYIWDISVKIDDQEYFSETATQWDSGPKPTFTKISYDDIPFSSTDGGGSSSEKVDNGAYLIDFDGTQANAYYTLTYDTWENAKGNPVTVKFDYYLEGEPGELFVENVAGGGGFASQETKSSKLIKGKNTFTFTTDSYARDGFCVGIKAADEKKSSTAKVYIWNIEMTIDGANYFSLDAKQWYSKTPLPAIKAISLDEIPKGSGKVTTPDEPDKYMLLQKNYTFTEEEGQLQYQAFTQWVGAMHNGSTIKPETTYVLSFKYYADPGEFESGVMGPPVAGFKTLDTGHCAEYPHSNIWMKADNSTDEKNVFLMESLGFKNVVIEVTTLKDQTDFIIALESGVDGDAYYWDFALVEKGTTENLLMYSSFIYDDLNKVITSNPEVGSIGWRTRAPLTGEKSNPTYSFVPLREELLDLVDGAVIWPEYEDDETDNSDKTELDKEVKKEASSEKTDDKGNSVLLIVIIAAGAILIIGAATVLILIKKRQNQA